MAEVTGAAGGVTEVPDETVVTVRLFAGARAAAGTAQTQVSAPGGAVLADLVGSLAAAHPGLARVLPACSFLVDGVATRPQQPVAGARTVDVLPPFSGG